MIRLAVRVARADAESVLAELLELAPGGLEEREVAPDAVEYVIYGAPGELPALPDLRAAAGDALVDVATTRDPRRLGRALEGVPPAGRRQLALPPAARAAAVGARRSTATGIDVVIDPGQAFGTGAHHTTRLCLELLLELEPGGALADWGCGSGVLAIAAARLGWEPVLACDSEPVAVEATRANAAANGVAGVSRDARRPAPRGGAVGAGRRSPTSSGRCCSTSRR